MQKIFKANWIFPVWLWIALLLISIVKLWLVSGQHLYFASISATYFDGGLFITLANHILHGQWLGDYNNLTLAKGSFYPLYIAATSFIHLPLLFSEQLLYLIACFVFLLSVQPIIGFCVNTNNKNHCNYNAKYIVTLLLGLLVIFNPISSDVQPATSTIREGIYPALSLLTSSLFIALLSYRKIKLWKFAIISFGAGLSISAFWLTREEGAWIAPITVALSLYSMGLIISERQTTPDWRKKVAITGLPFLVLFLAIYSISFINFRYYGVGNTVEFKTPEFVSAYSSLTRVQDGTWMPIVPVSAHNRQLIYRVSPAFAELQPYLEGGHGQGWTNMSGSVYPQYKGEIIGGWFMWAFRDAVAEAGYYKNGQIAMNYYATLATQVNTACDQGKLTCVKSTNSMNPPLDRRYIRPFISALHDSFSLLTSFKGYSPIPVDASTDDGSISLVSSITHHPVTSTYGHRRVAILAKIGGIYQDIFPILTYLSIVSYIVLSFLKRSYKDPLFIIIGMIAFTILARMILLSLISATSFYAVFLLYFSCAYPLLIIFNILTLIFLCKRFIFRSANLGTD